MVCVPETAVEDGDQGDESQDKSQIAVPKAVRCCTIDVTTQTCIINTTFPI